MKLGSSCKEKPVAAGAGLFPARFGGPAPAAGASAGGGPEAQGGRGGRGRGGAAPAPGAYIAYALPKK